MISEGKYRAQAREWGFGLTSTQKEQVAVRFEILDGAEAGQHITWYGFFTDGTFDRTVESLRHCGWQGVDLSDGLPGLDANEVEIVVEHDTYNNKTSAKVRWVNANGGGLAMESRLNDGGLKSFAARMRSRVAAIPAKKGAAPQPSRPPARPAAQSQPQPQPPPDDGWGESLQKSAPPPGFDDDRPF